MADTGLIRLFSWLSPAFPIGGFAYSQGLETAIAEERVRSGAALADWIGGQLHRGGLRMDAYFLAIAAQAIGKNRPEALAEANRYALALQFCAERDKETREQARSFLDAASAWPLPLPSAFAEILDAPTALPIAFGAMAGLNGIDTRQAAAGFVNAAIGQQVSVGLRLIPLGQSAGLAIQARFENHVAALAEDAVLSRLDDISGVSHGTDIASLRHEDLTVRIFRS